MRNQMLLAILLTLLSLLVLGITGGLILGNVLYQEPTYVFPEFSRAEYTAHPAPLPSVEVITGSASRPSPSLLAPPGVTEPRQRFYPAIPEDLEPISSIAAKAVDLYLLSLDTLRPALAERVDERTPEALIALLRTPDARLADEGFAAAIPEKTDLKLLGIVKETKTLYLLLDISAVPGIGSLTEAVLLDCLVLSMTGYDGIDALQFVIELEHGYQGRIDLSFPRDRDNLCSLVIIP